MKRGHLHLFWYQKNPLAWILYPFSLGYQLIITIRRWYLQKFRQVIFKIPVIVVGNISVGGVGKTPLVIAIAQHFKNEGLLVGVVSRGYKAKCTRFPRVVEPLDTAVEVGDEPLLIAQKTGVPVVIDPNRVEAVRYLIDQYKPDVIISDDGLQHYRMGRTMEIAVIDGQRGLGNGFCLPAGPLREPPSRLKSVNCVVVNQGAWSEAEPMELAIDEIVHALSGEVVSVDQLGYSVRAIAGIGNPERFFSSLRALGLTVEGHDFPDHHYFVKSDLVADDRPLLMTEKDAVKCRHLMHQKCYYIKVSAKLGTSFWQSLKQTINTEYEP